MGTSAGQIGVTGAAISYGGTTIGAFAGGTGSNDLVVTFSSYANPTPAAYRPWCAPSPTRIPTAVPLWRQSPVNGTGTTNEDTAYTFSANDFHFNDTDSAPLNTFTSVQIYLAAVERVAPAERYGGER